MMKKKTSIILGSILLLIAVIFVGVAVSHPEFSFPWSLRITYMFYGLYVWLLFRFLLVIPVFQHIQGVSSNGSIVRAIIYMLMAIVFFMMEVTGDKVDIYTFLRGFVVTGSIDVCCENIYLLVKGKRK